MLVNSTVVSVVNINGLGTDTDKSRFRGIGKVIGAFSNRLLFDSSYVSIVK